MSTPAPDVRRTRLLQLAGVLVAALVVVGVLIAISAGGSDDDAPAKRAGEAVAGQTEVAARFAGIPQDGIALGDPDAPVTLVEFADMQCPFCADFARDGLPALVENEVKAGTLRIEFRSMAFIGEDSQTLARAVAGAAAQDKLWQALDLLFINQGQENSGFATDEFLRTTLGAVAGLDVDKALADGEGADGTNAINQAQQLADANGVSSTPSFLIGKTGETLKKLDVTSLDGSEIRDAVKELAGA
jgi:protein-disulfide isomerase